MKGSYLIYRWWVSILVQNTFVYPFLLFQKGEINFAGLFSCEVFIVVRGVEPCTRFSDEMILRYEFIR